MNARHALLALLVLFGVVLLTDVSWRKRQQERELREEIDNPDRFVDIGVELRTVVADPNGTELIEGKPPMRLVRVQRFGGMLDTRANPPRLVGPSRDRTIWYCSEDQEPAILHGDELPLGQLVMGSEGSGKTTATGQWIYFRWLEVLGEDREGGVLAPTEARLEMFVSEFQKLWPAHWYTRQKADRRFTLADGTRIQMVPTHRPSAAGGSPVQGYSWSFSTRDESQDISPDIHADIESRGRAAKRGQYKQLATATAKDSSAWRNFRDSLIDSGVWMRRTMLGTSSPFIWPKFWADKKSTMTDREYRRRILAEDLPAELAVYYGWLRDRNLVARPQIASDVTASVLAGYSSYTRPGSRFTMIVGHDPGNIYNTSTVAKLLMFGEVPTWIVIGELQTKQTTAGQHAKQLRAYLQSLGVEHEGGSKAAIFVDPHGRGEGQTDYQTVYMAMQKEGLDVFTPAAITGKVKRSARVGMINRLFCAADGVVRLVVACDQRKQPLAPVLVDALESLQKKEGDEDPEGSQRKDASDKTHAPASLGYALWAFEQEALTDHTQRIAMAEGRRLR